MKPPDDWRVEKGSSFQSELESQPANLCWQDAASPLRVYRLGGADEGVIRLRIGTGLIVDVFPDRRVVTRAATGLSPATVDHSLTDLVYPRLRSHAGEFVIHAGGIGIGEAAFVLLGLSGRGKSTLATSFYKAGYALLGDDAMVVSAIAIAPCVCAVYPSLRLFPDSIAALILDAASAEAVSPQSAKQRIDLADRDLVQSPRPLRALFRIGEPAADDHIEVRQLSLAEACMALVENSFALDPSDTARAHERMDQASALARAVPAFEIRYPRDYARLPEVRQAILDQVAVLEAA